MTLGVVEGITDGVIDGISLGTADGADAPDQEVSDLLASTSYMASFGLFKVKDHHVEVLLWKNFLS
jgi:hypothetical protein